MTNTSLGRLAGRGAVVNLVFGIGLQLLAVAQAVLIPRLLGADAIGLFALASAGVGIGLTLKGVDVAGKVVQERDVDLYTAYGVAMTLELGMATLMLLVMMGVAPILAAVYHRPQLWPVTSVLALTLFEAALLSIPASIPYREMRFLKRNLFTAVGPLVTFVVTLALALSGAGIWSLVAGTVAGTAVAGALLLRVSSIRPHFSWDGAVVRRFLRFGIPPWLGQMVTMVAGWGSVAVVAGTIGIAGLAYVNLAQGWAYMILQLDAFMADAVFPALCAVRDSDDRLRRTFIVTNRLSIAWGATVGLGLLLFAAPAVHLLLGPKWHPAVLLIQASAVAVVINAIGYNWKNYYSARGDTRPTLVTNLAASAWLAMVFIPLTLTLHLGGAAIAIVIMAVGGYIQRQIYVSRFFPGLHLLPMVWRELCAVGAAGGVTGIARLAGWEPNGWASFVLQGTLFVALCVAAGWPLCGPLVRIVLGYVRSGSGAPTVESIESGPEPLRIPNRFAFPLGVAADPDGRTLWITTRDWPALGRIDTASGEALWTTAPAFPHLPTPDGRGGCWAALTRHSAVAHFDREGRMTSVPLGRTRELLVTCLAAGRVWVVDSGRRCLWAVDADPEKARHQPPLRVALPEGTARPDFVVEASDGRLWVSDTALSRVTIVDPGSLDTTVIDVPHPVRAIVRDPSTGVMWLGASDRPAVTLAYPPGVVGGTWDLPDVPFGLSPDRNGRLVVTLRGRSQLAIVEPWRRDFATVTLAEGGSPLGCAVVDDHCYVAMSSTSEVHRVEVPSLWPAVTQAEVLV